MQPTHNLHIFRFWFIQTSEPTNYSNIDKQRKHVYKSAFDVLFNYDNSFSSLYSQFVHVERY